jgi:hypothetical protein
MAFVAASLGGVLVAEPAAAKEVTFEHGALAEWKSASPDELIIVAERDDLLGIDGESTDGKHEKKRL